MRKTIETQGPIARRWLLLAGVVGTPLLFFRPINDPINVPKVAFLLVIVLTAAAIKIAEVLQNRDVDGLKLLTVPATCLAAPLLIGWLLSPYKGWAVWGAYPRMLGLLPYLLVIGFGVLLADAFRGEAAPIAWATLIAGGTAGAYAALQFLGLDPFDWSVKGTAAAENLVVSTLGNPNFAGAFFAIVLPVGLALFFIETHRRVQAGVATAFVAVGWVVAGSQAAWAAGVAAAVLVAGYLVRTKLRMAPVLAALVAIGVAGVVVGSVLAGVAGVGESIVPDTIQRRSEWWRAAGEMGASSPLAGRGPNAFALEHPQYRTVEDARQVGLDITDDPHSLFFSFFTAAGAIGVLGLLGAIGWVAVRARDLARQDLLAAGFAGGLVAYLIQALVSIDTAALRTAGWTVLAGLVATAGVATKRASSSSTKRKKRQNEPVRGLAGVLLAAFLPFVGLWQSGRLIAADSAFSRGSTALQEGDGRAALEAYEKASGYGLNIEYRRAYGQLLGDIAVGLGDPEGAEYIERSNAAFSFVDDLPHVNATLDHAQVLYAWSKIEPSAEMEALAAYLLAAERDPVDPPLLVEVTDVALEQGEDDVVIDLLDPVAEAIDQAGIWGNLALAHAHQGDDQAATTAVQRALALEPEEPTALETQALLEKAAPDS